MQREEDKRILEMIQEMVAIDAKREPLKRRLLSIIKKEAEKGHI